MDADIGRDGQTRVIEDDRQGVVGVFIVRNRKVFDQNTVCSFLVHTYNSEFVKARLSVVAIPVNSERNFIKIVADTAIGDFSAHDMGGEKGSF